MTDKKKRAQEIDRRLAERYPDAHCELDFNNAFELLIATILAAQSTDVRVNIVTKSLFRKYPGPAAFANANQVEMEKDVKQTGFFRNKAKAVINWSSSPASAARPRTSFSARPWASTPAWSSTRTSTACPAASD